MALMTTEQAAEWLQMSPSTLRKDARTGRLGIPTLRIGRSVRYREKDLERWASKHVEIPGVMRR